VKNYHKEPKIRRGVYLGKGGLGAKRNRGGTTREKKSHSLISEESTGEKEKWAHVCGPQTRWTHYGVGGSKRNFSL